MTTPSVRIRAIRRPLDSETQKPKPEDWVRAELAFALFLLLASEVGAALWIAALRVGPEIGPAIENLKGIFTLVFTPTVGLFGAATGFYYGTRTETRASS